MRYVVTSEFLRQFELLDERAEDRVRGLVDWLLGGHETAWARQARIKGELGEAWVFHARVGDESFRLYWSYLDEETIVMLLLRRE